MSVLKNCFLGTNSEVGFNLPRNSGLEDFKFSTCQALVNLLSLRPFVGPLALRPLPKASNATSSVEMVRQPSAGENLTAKQAKTSSVLAM